MSTASTLGLTLAITHGLPTDHAGVFFAATSLFLLANAVGGLGTNTGLVYFLSRARSLGTPEAVPVYFRTAVRPVVAVGVLMAVLLFVFAPQVSAVINGHHVQLSTDYVRMIVVFIPLAGLENVVLAGTRGMGTMRPNVVTEQLLRPGLQLVLVLLSAALLEGRGVGLAWAFAYLPAAVLAYGYWRRVTSRAHARALRGVDDRTGGRLGEAGPAKFWRFTAPRAAAGVAQMAMQRLDIVLVAALAGAVPAAIYAASTRFLVVGQTGQRAVSLAVQPRIGEALAVHDVAAAKQLYRVSTSWLVLVTWPTYLVFAFFGTRLLTIFGHDYRAGSGVLLLLSLVMLFATGCGMVDMVLNMAGRTSWNVMNVGLSLGVQLGLDLWLIPRHGILGAAIGWGVAIVLANLVPLLQIALTLGLHPFGRTTLVAMTTTVGCFGAVPAIFFLALGQGWWSLVLSLVVGGAAYAAALWRFRQVLHLTELAGIRGRRRR